MVTDILTYIFDFRCNTIETKIRWFYKIRSLYILLRKGPVSSTSIADRVTDWVLSTGSLYTTYLFTVFPIRPNDSSLVINGNKTSNRTLNMWDLVKEEKRRSL